MTTMKQSIWLAIALLAAGCERPLPAPPPQAAVRAVGGLIRDQVGRRIAGAVCRLQDTPGWVTATSSATDGSLLWTPVLASLRATHVECAAPGYVPRSEPRTLTTGANEDLAPFVMTPLVVARRGLVRLDGHAFDDDGPFLGLGASLFWAGWGCLHDRERLKTRNLAALKGQVDYLRVLAVVGPAGWTDRTVTADEMAAAVACITDLAYDTYGLRVDWTIFGGIDTTPTAADREALVRRFVSVITPRARKVQRVQLGNESWQIGFSSDEGRAELRRLARLVHDGAPNIISTTSPRWTDLEERPTSDAPRVQRPFPSHSSSMGCAGS